jgi:hypothetical protein
MALRTRRRNEIERPSFTRSVDAAIGFVEGSRRVSGALGQDVFLALGCIAEATGAGDAVRRSIATGVAAIGDRRNVATREILDRLLDVRSAAARSVVPDGA